MPNIYVRNYRRKNRFNPGAVANKIARQKQIQKIKTQAIKEIGTLSDKEFEIAGLMLYWSFIRATLKRKGLGIEKTTFIEER